ncbi:hypothetical protein HCN44_010898 [Aphidius gifuensis]|uniref:Uncharacterized protein n=1 Tax=Aphidius gifuensis TaxID=684658 RepID=A0A834Y337_APHGI|nr:hypothetical protein HCN44_010898 [Aphidius gifuensis]
MSSLYEDDENPRPSFNMSPKNLDDAGSSLDNESWKSPQSYIGEETYHVKKNNFLESSSRNSKFCMKSKILKQHSNSSKRDVETENAVEILTAEKASLVTKNEELEKEIKLLQEMTQNLQDAEKKMQNDLNWIAYQAKMIRTREKAKLDDASTDESAESDEQSEDDSRDKQIKKIAFVSTDKVSHDDEDGSSSVDENEEEDDPLTDESQE